MKRIDLNGLWKFRMLSSRGKTNASRAEAREWMPASVPGTVHTDLLAAGRIPDPFYRMNEFEVQWIDAERWLYRKEFVVPDGFFDKEAIQLVAEGLDTFTHILLNGSSIADTANMFVVHRIDIKRLLRNGTNTLEIIFDSPTLRAKQMEQRYNLTASMPARRNTHSAGTGDQGLPRPAFGGTSRSRHFQNVVFAASSLGP
jgi:beta-mannosidase